MEADIKGRGENRATSAAAILPLFGEGKREKEEIGEEIGDQIMLYGFCW